MLTESDEQNGDKNLTLIATICAIFSFVKPNPTQPNPYKVVILQPNPIHERAQRTSNSGLWVE